MQFPFDVATRSLQGSDGAVINMNGRERTISAVTGGVLLLFGLSRLSLSTIAVTVAGGVLLYRGFTGHCAAYEALNITSVDTTGRDERVDQVGGAPRGIARTCCSTGDGLAERSRL